MALSWRDAIATPLVAAATAVTVAVVNGWNWLYIGDARAGIVAVFSLGFAACVVGGGPAWMFAGARRTGMWGTQTTSGQETMGSGGIWSPFFFLAAGLGALAFVLMFIGVIVNSIGLLVWSTALVVAIWLVTTIHHAVETRPQRVPGAGPKPA